MFPCGNITLEGVWHVPQTTGHFPIVIVCHPRPLYGGSMSNNVVLAICQALPQQSITAFRFNFRGVGRSGGEYGEGIAEQEDVWAALNFVVSIPEIAPAIVGLAGYSFGAWTAGQATIRDDRVRAFAAVALPMTEAYLVDLSQYTLPKCFVTGSRDTLSRPGLALNLANRLDSLCALFAVGKAPTSSADPFALRRHALALTANLIETKTDFSLAEGLQLAVALMPVEVSAQSLADTAGFIQRRLEGILREEYNLAHDVVQAVLAERGDNPWPALVAARELAAAVSRDDWEDTLNAYARCVRIVRGLKERYTVQPDRFIEPAEKASCGGYLRVACLTSIRKWDRRRSGDPISYAQPVFNYQ